MTDYEVFRKGQIVPRRLGKAFTSLRKAQNCITFGADTVYCGGVFYSDARDGGAVILMRHDGRKRKNGTRQRFNTYLRNIYIVQPTNERPQGVWPNFSDFNSGRMQVTT